MEWGTPEWLQMGAGKSRRKGMFFSYIVITRMACLQADAQAL